MRAVGAGAAATPMPGGARPSFGARPQLAATLAPAYQDLGPLPAAPGQLPIVYHDRYNVRLLGIEKLHPFDSCKFAKVAAGLQARGVVSAPGQLVTPKLPGRSVVEGWHDPAYIQALYSSPLKVAQVTELAPLALLPACLLRRGVLASMEAHVAGSCLAAALAVVHGWAVNLGGGMHHAHAGDGMGWCPFADIYVAIDRLRAASAGAIRRVVIIDLDAHQGNGVARDKVARGDADTILLDAYNASIFPLDEPAKRGIDIRVELQSRAGDEAYLSALEGGLAALTERCAAAGGPPDLVFYNAGTDVLEGDPLGRLRVSAAAVAARDARVFAWAALQGSPIVMALSGGYTRASAGVIVDSLAALCKQFSLTDPPPA